MWKKLFISALVALFVLLLYNALKDGASNLINAILSALSPIILGAFFAYLLNHFVKFFEKVFRLFRLRNYVLIRTLSVIVSIVTVVGLLALIVLLIVPAIEKIGANGGVGGFIEEIKVAIVEIDGLLGLSGDWSLSRLIGEINVNEINTYLESLALSLLSSLSTIGISLLLAVMMLLEKDKVISNLKMVADRVFSSPDKIKNGVGCAVVILDGYVLGKIIEGSVTGIAFGVFCAILGVPFSILLGLIMAIFFTVPYVGGYIALVPTVLLALTVSPLCALIGVVGGIVIINVIGTFISPLIFKNTLKITPLTILASTIVGGSVFGIWGFLLAPPVVATVKVYCQVFLKQRK